MNLADYFARAQIQAERRRFLRGTCSYCGSAINESEEDGPCPTQLIDEAAKALA